MKTLHGRVDWSKALLFRSIGDAAKLDGRDSLDLRLRPYAVLESIEMISSQSGSAVRRRAREAMVLDEKLPGAVCDRLLSASRMEDDPAFCHNNKSSKFKVGASSPQPAAVRYIPPPCARS